MDARRIAEIRELAATWLGPARADLIALCDLAERGLAIEISEADAERALAAYDDDLRTHPLATEAGLSDPKRKRRIRLDAMASALSTLRTAEILSNPKHERRG